MRKAIILVLVFCSVLLGAQNYGTVGQPSGGPPGGTDDQLLSISNDTLTIEDGNFVVLPQGADSLGNTHTATRVLYSAGARAAASKSGFTFDPATNIFETPGETRLSRTSTGLVTVGIASGFNTSSLILKTGSGDGLTIDAQTLGTGFRGIGEFDFITINSGGLGKIRFSPHETTRLSVETTGQLIASAYNSGTAFAGTDAGMIGHSASGAFQSMNAADVNTFLGTLNDGSETKVTAGTNISVTGTGTAGSPYVVNNTLSADGLGSSPTTGAILFGQGTTTAAIDATNLFWDDANNRLGVGTNAPSRDLHVLNTGNAYMLLDKGSGNYTEFREIATQLRVNNYSASGNASIDINPVASDGTSSQFFRFFRESNSTGSTYFDVFLGDGTATTNARIAGKGLDSFFAANNGNVGIGTSSPNAYGKLDISSTTGALIVPRMTTTQRDAMTATAGMIIYNTTTGTFQGYTTSWTNL